MRAPVARGMTIALLGVTVPALAAAVVLGVMHVGVELEGAVPEPESMFVWLQCASAVVFSAAAVVLLRRPEIGWSVLCAGAALSHAVAAAAFGWAVQSAVIDPGLPGADVAVWLLSWALPVEVIALNWMAVTVPDGRLPKGYLRWPAVYSVAAPVLAVVLSLLAELDASGFGFR